MRVLAAAALLAASSARAQAPSSERWALPPEPPSAEDTLGLAARNEDVAGAHGRIRLDPSGDFVRGDGVPIRFWAATTEVQQRSDVATLRRHVRELARRGVNMLRHHGHVNPGPLRPITAVNEREVDAIQRLVALAKQEGIYTTYSPYWAKTSPADSWQLEGYKRGPPWGLLFFDEKLQAAYKGWLREVLLRPNPHDPSATPLARDPALAVFSIQNEDSLLFNTAESLTPPQRAHLDRRYQAWRAARGLANSGKLELIFWGIASASPNRRDSMRFLTETMRAWNVEVERFLREEIGYTGLVNAGNWRTADDARLLDLERWSYAANDVIAVNRYVSGGGHNNPKRPAWARYRIARGDLFGDSSALGVLERIPTNVRQVRGRAFAITESSWVAPMSFRAEAPLVIAAYASLHGIDAFYWYRLRSVGFDATLDKWGAGPPDLLGGWPAAALLYRRGDVKRGAPVVVEARTQAGLFSLAQAALQEAPGFDPNRDKVDSGGVTTGSVDPLAHFVGPTLLELDAKRDATAVSPFAESIDRSAKIVRSNTGEIALDWGKQVLLLDTPRAQAAAGFLAQRSPLTLRDLRIATRTEYLALLAVSLDDRPLRESRSVLVQLTTRARPTGWLSEPVEIPPTKPGKPPWRGQRVLSLGDPPWEIWSHDVRVELRNPHVTRARVLDPHLRPRGAALPLERSGEWASLKPPGDAMYVVLEAPAPPASAPPAAQPRQ